MKNLLKFLILFTATSIAHATNIPHYLEILKPQRDQSLNDQIAFIAPKLNDIPYKDNRACRTGFDCQTFTETVMSLLYSNTLSQYEQNLQKIGYGALGVPSIHMANRNHFIDKDWNPINQQNGFLQDVTSRSPLSRYAKKTSARIDRQNWFINQRINVSMPRKLEKVSITYLPKTAFITHTYQPNTKLFEKIPTPAVMEVVRDTKKWIMNGRPIKEKLGTELNVSHMGFLYRKTFKKGELIYYSTYCYFDWRSKRKCDVTPVICNKAECPELMLAHATVSHPDGFYWYKKSNGQYTCTSTPPKKSVKYTMCNRVEQIPLFNYLADYQYGYYWYLEDPSFLGVHVEKLVG